MIGQNEQLQSFQDRFRFLYGILIVMASILFLRLWYLQILKGEEFKKFRSECLSAGKAATPAQTPQERMKSCMAEAKQKGLKGEEFKKFRSDCLSGKEAVEWGLAIECAPRAQLDERYRFDRGIIGKSKPMLRLFQPAREQGTRARKVEYPAVAYRSSLRTNDLLGPLTPGVRAILASAARLVKPGGRLVYATCSLLDAENEVIANEFAAAHPDFERLDAAEALDKAQVERAAELTENGALRLWPHRHATDGFFAAAWERKS